MLFVVGSGFDPRAVTVLERLTAATTRRIDGLLIELPEGTTDLAVRSIARTNRERIGNLVERGGGALRSQGLPEYNDSRSLGRLISREFQEAGILDAYGEVVLEISAMPRSVFFPLIRGVLERSHLSDTDSRRWSGDLHVAVCENPEADESVLEEGTTPMAPIGGFAGGRGEKPTTTIWVPVLGERAAVRVRALYEELEPDETCPVLPWPSRDPRRGDRLMLEHRRLLFEDIRLEPRTSSTLRSATPSTSTELWARCTSVICNHFVRWAPSAWSYHLTRPSCSPWVSFLPPTSTILSSSTSVPARTAFTKARWTCATATRFTMFG